MLLYAPMLRTKSRPYHNSIWPFFSTLAIKNDLSRLTFLTQNCNSLNISTGFYHKNRYLKQSLRNWRLFSTDFILLQDTYLGTRGENILKNKLQYNNCLDYNLYVNSSMNKRGGAILINKRTQTIGVRYNKMS